MTEPSPDLLAAFTKLGEGITTTATKATEAARQAHADLQQMEAVQHAETERVAQLERQIIELREAIRVRVMDMRVAEGISDSCRRFAGRQEADARCLAEVVARSRQQEPGVLVAGGPLGDPAATQAFETVTTRPDEPALLDLGNGLKASLSGESCRHCDTTIAQGRDGLWVHSETGVNQCTNRPDSTVAEPIPGDAERPVRMRRRLPSPPGAVEVDGPEEMPTVAEGSEA